MNKRAATKLAKELAKRAPGHPFQVVRFTQENGRKSYHVVRGLTAEIQQLARRLDSHWEHVAEHREPIAVDNLPMESETVAFLREYAEENGLSINEAANQILSEVRDRFIGFENGRAVFRDGPSRPE